MVDPIPPVPQKDRNIATKAVAKVLERQLSGMHHIVSEMVIDPNDDESWEAHRTLSLKLIEVSRAASELAGWVGHKDGK